MFYFLSGPWKSVSHNPSPKAQRQCSCQHRPDSISPASHSSHRELDHGSPGSSPTHHRDLQEVWYVLDLTDKYAHLSWYAMPSWRALLQILLFDVKALRILLMPLELLAATSRVLPMTEDPWHPCYFWPCCPIGLFLKIMVCQSHQCRSLSFLHHQLFKELSTSFVLLAYLVLYLI